MRLAFAAALGLASSVVLAQSPDTPPAPDLAALAPNVWVKLHAQQPGDAVRFGRQEHGGGCFDTKRGVLILFGSNSHGKDWHNSPRIFDPAANRWTQLYPDDDFQTYAVNEKGIPVAGPNGDHPWVSHTFGTLVYDTARDEMIVPIFDDHLVPGRFTSVMSALWPKATFRANWVLARTNDTWRPLPCPPQNFFPFCATYDRDRGAVLGYRGDGIWELSGEPRAWKRVSDKALLGGYHCNAVYDTRHKAMVVFGHHGNRNDVEVYWPATGEQKLLSPAPEAPAPPKDQHNPMAYEPELDRTVVLVDHTLPPAAEGATPVVQAETWLFDLGANRWQAVPSATLPFGLGMNYDLAYDPPHKCLLLVTGSGWGGAVTTVWALRLAR